MASDEERGAKLIRKWWLEDRAFEDSDMMEVVPGQEVLRGYAVQTGKLLRRVERLEKLWAAANGVKRQWERTGGHITQAVSALVNCVEALEDDDGEG